MEEYCKNHVIHDKSWLHYFCGWDYIIHNAQEEKLLQSEVKKSHFDY